MIKSRMQTDGFSAETGKKYRSTWDCVRTVWRTEGVSAFTRGLGPTLIRYACRPSSCVHPLTEISLVRRSPTAQPSLDLSGRCVLSTNYRRDQVSERIPTLQMEWSSCIPIWISNSSKELKRDTMGGPCLTRSRPMREESKNHTHEDL